MCDEIGPYYAGLGRLERTNSILVAGSRNDLDVIEAIIARLDDTDIQERRHEAIRLRNSQANEVANAVTTFLKAATDPYKVTLNPNGSYLDLQREVFVIAEPISNVKSGDRWIATCENVTQTWPEGSTTRGRGTSAAAIAGSVS